MKTIIQIDEEPLSRETIEKIEKVLEEIKKGRVYSTSQIKKILGIE